MVVSRTYIEEAAVASGWQAYAVARILRRHWRDEVEDLPLHLRAPLEDYLEALQRAGRRWADRQGGTAEPATAELAVNSKVMEPGLTTSQAAGLLGCSERNVRKLIAAGTLPAQRTRNGWQLDPGAVHAYHQGRQGGAR